MTASTLTACVLLVVGQIIFDLLELLLQIKDFGGTWNPAKIQNEKEYTKPKLRNREMELAAHRG